MNQICDSPLEDEIKFNLLPDDINEHEEHQKLLKNIISEFKNNQEYKAPKKLYNSSNINKVPNISSNNRNLHPKNVNNIVNEDGTRSETKIERMQDGREKITKTRYDRNNNIISRKVYYNDDIYNNNYNNNYNNINNYNYNNNMINNYNIINPNRGHIFRASNGLSIETTIKRLPNGKKMEVKTIRDENNNVIDVQEDEIIENNYYMANNYPRQPPMNSMPPNMNNYNQNNHFVPNARPSPHLNNFRINNQMNHMNNNLNINMNNNMNYLANMPYQMAPQIMNNYGYPHMNMMMPMMPMLQFMPIPYPNDVKRVDQRILNSLPENELEDASKLDPDNKNCVICLEDFKDKERIICLPCIHVFHSECIKSWLTKDNCCPTCKFELTFENLNSQ